MESARKRVWYLHAINDNPVTSKIITHWVIGGQNFEDSMRENVECVDGVCRNLFICEYPQITKAVEAIPEYHLRLDVFWCYEGSDPGRWRFWEKLVRKQINNARRAKRITKGDKKLLKKVPMPKRSIVGKINPRNR